MKEKFNIVLYDDRTNTHKNENEARRETFGKTNRNLENIPQTQDALYLYVMKAALQTGIWAKSCIPKSEIPTPGFWG